MTDKKKKIIEEFISKVILNSDLEEISKKDQERIENFLIEKLQEERESLIIDLEKLKKTHTKHFEYRGALNGIDIYSKKEMDNKIDILIEKYKLEEEKV